MGITTAPPPLADDHQLSRFDCGNDTLNDWLKRRALKNQANAASRTFVICRDEQVVGYYALASGSVERMAAPKSVARNMPEPILVMVLGRLAVDKTLQGQQLGAALLKDALLRALTVARNIGIRAVLVHAISEEAKRFYQSYGFQMSPVDSMTLMLPVRYIEKLL